MIRICCVCLRILGFRWGGWRNIGKRSHGYCAKCAEMALKEIA